MPVRDCGVEIWNEQSEDFCERLAVPAYQRIGRCARQFDATWVTAGKSAAIAR
jgi:hypothetical protein